jgi:hypothetical protein
MSTFNLSAVTIPTPEPYDKKDPQKQLENLSYVLLQIISTAKLAGFTFNDAQGGLSVDVSGLEGAIRDLKYNEQVLDLGVARLQFLGKTVSMIT